jgi:hypothetical protein
MVPTADVELTCGTVFHMKTGPGHPDRQKWMNFYTKVLSKFAGNKGLRLTVRFELDADGSISDQRIQKTRAALRELGLDDGVHLE